MDLIREQWQEELGNSIREIEGIERLLGKKVGVEMQEVLAKMRMSITLHSAKMIDWNDVRDPLFIMAVPAVEELVVRKEEIEDPIGDVDHERIPFMTHRYRNRVLVYVTFACSQYCRFCFRRFRTGNATIPPSLNDMEKIRQYLVAHPEIDEVILSGGDPLTLTDDHFSQWLKMLRSVPTVIRIRIHTRVPVNLPSRITPEFVALLRKYQDATHPIIFVTHFNHYREIAAENITVLALLIEAGIVVRNQSVLLAGVNDNEDVLSELFTKLTNVRVQPYYIHQLDLARGTNHFRVPIARGLEIMDRVGGRVSGIAMPRYVLDMPGGKGKVMLLKQNVVRMNEDEGGQVKYRITTQLGETVDYLEPM